MQNPVLKAPEPAHDRHNHIPVPEPPFPVTGNNANEEPNPGTSQTTKDRALEQTKLNIKLSARERLDALSDLRIHPDSINFTSAKLHAYGGKADLIKATLKQGDGSDEQPVAVKKLRYNDDINKRGFSNEFVNEVEIMAGLSHENIVQLIGFVEDLENGKAWFVLSWEPNGNISEFLATGEWEIPERLSLIKDTFVGIEFLHTRQPPICHGDLKSFNILVSASYRAIITDFGSSRLLEGAEDCQDYRDEAPDVTTMTSATDEQLDHTRITIVASSNQLTLTGPAWSLRWVAPEVAMGQPQNLASDIWAAGWICWEIMTNKVPFPELNSEGAITLKVIQGQVPVAHEDTQLSQIVRLCSLMTDCWLINPRNRPNVSQCNNEIKRMPSIFPSGGKSPDSSGPSASLLLQMGRIDLLQGNVKDAISLFQQGLSTAVSTGDQETSAEALAKLGRTCYLTSKYAEAGQYFAQAFALHTRIGVNSGQADALYWLAKVSHAQSKLDQAEVFYTEARGIYLNIGHEGGHANTLHGLGNIFHDRSQYSKAEELYNLARDIYGCLGHHGGQANTLRRLGKLSLDRAEYVKAEEAFNEALELYSRVGDNVGRANVMYNLGRLHLTRGLNTQAVTLFAEARSIFSQIGKSKMEKNCSHWLDVASKAGGLAHDVTSCA